MRASQSVCLLLSCKVRASSRPQSSVLMLTFDTGGSDSNSKPPVQDLVGQDWVIAGAGIRILSRKSAGAAGV